MDWAEAPEGREQLVLFPMMLDEAIGPNHKVRLLDDILSRLNWTKWEAQYDLRRGQPPIHPKVLASVILYGLLTRIRSSRLLEEALQVRLDFRWLAEGRSIDHTTISKFRRKNAEALKDTFVQIGLVAREIGCLSLETLAFDGTRIRSNNRRSGTRTPARLRLMKNELAEKFIELEAKIAAIDEQDEKLLGEQGSFQLSDELAKVKHRQHQVDKALAEIDRLEQASEKVPDRVPVVDAQSRVMPNKEGGYAPNYTALATVDVDSGLIVSADVITTSDEAKHFFSSIGDVQDEFQPPKTPMVLADSLISTVENLAQCAALGIDLYSPVKGEGSPDNPALRDDPTQPVLVSDRDRLPTKKVRRNNKQIVQLDKTAFIYDKDKDCFWCPEGKALPFIHTTSHTHNKRHIVRRRYKSNPLDCQACPLKSRCFQNDSGRRTVNRQTDEEHREAQIEKMATAEAQEKYSRRRHPGERPFAVIKHEYGARRFLLRGLNRVKQEWYWLAGAFNLSRLFTYILTGQNNAQLNGFRTGGIGPPI